MQFPLDHGTHSEELEWHYFWGKLSNETFFHFARFRMNYGGSKIIFDHCSTHNHESKYFERLAFEEFTMVHGEDLSLCEFHLGGRKGAVDRFGFEMTNAFGLICYPQSKPVVHDVSHERNYYSIPYLSVKGFMDPEAKRVTGDAWFDHEFSRINEFKGWDWISLKLDSGMWVLVYDCDIDRFCSVGMGDKIIKSEFVIEGNILKVLDLGMTFTMIPTVEEKVFDPKFGVKYSEVPFYAYATTGAYPVMSGKRLGFGMRERTRRDGGHT